MELVAEAVRDALGTNDPRQVEEAVGEDREGLWRRVKDNYVALKRRQVPLKEPGEYVPAWFLEQKNIGAPDTAAQYFVARSLLYAHRVGVVDYLAYYCDEDLMLSSGVAREDLKLWQDYAPPDLEDLLVKILTFAPLEELGLLYYLTPPLSEETANGASRVLPSVASEDQLEAYFKEYMSQRGQYFEPDWNSAGDVFTARCAAEVELAHTMVDLQRALRFFGKWHEFADVYTSGYPSYRDGIQFLMRLKGQTLLLGAPNSDTSTLEALWRLPGLSSRALRKLSVQNLIDMRDEKVFRIWRSTLQDATSAYSARELVSGDDRQFSDFVNVVKGAEGTLLDKARSSRKLEGVFGDVRDFGISVAMGSAGAGAGAMASNGDLGSAIVSGALGAVAPQLPAVADVIADATKGWSRVRAVERHIALFGC